MFYSNDHAPIHVHILKDGHEAKYNVDPVEQVFNHGFKKHDIFSHRISTRRESGDCHRPLEKLF